MERKVYQAPMQIKNETTGEVESEFATLNVRDYDGDVTLPGAFADGEAVRIAHWNHGWNELPVGRGAIHEADDKAVLRGRFFLDTITGQEHYKTVRNLGELQQWSYGFDVLESESGEFEGQKVRFLKKLKVHEVSPVMLGAGIDTRTTLIKAAEPEAADAPAQTDGEAAKSRKPSGEAERMFVEATLQMIEHFGGSE